LKVEPGGKALTARLISGIEFLPIRRRDTRNEDVRIEGRHGSHGEDVAIVRIDDDRGRPAKLGMPQGLLADHLDAGIEREVDVVAGFGREDTILALDHPFHALAQHPLARRPAQILVHARFDLRFSVHIRLVEVVVGDVRQRIDVERRPDVAEEVRGERAVDILAHRLDGNVDARQTDIVFGELRDSREIDLFLVGEGHERVVAIMLLQVLGIVVPGQIELLEARDDGVIDDLDDVRLLHLLLHLLDRREILDHRHGTHLPPVTAHHVGQIEVDLVAGAIGHERHAVAIPNLAAHAGNAHGDLGASGNFFGPHLSARDLFPPELADEHTETAKDDEAQEDEAEFGGRAAGHINETA